MTYWESLVFSRWGGGYKKALESRSTDFKNFCILKLCDNNFEDF